jgi:hypothetical protein
VTSRYLEAPMFLKIKKVAGLTAAIIVIVA